MKTECWRKSATLFFGCAMKPLISILEGLTLEDNDYDHEEKEKFNRPIKGFGLLKSLWSDVIPEYLSFTGPKSNFY